MCTSVALIKNNVFFGRNMDIDCSFGECGVNTPRNFPLAFKKTEIREKHYAFIGTAAVENNFPLYAEAMNENGLYIAALKFSGYAVYNTAETKGKINLAPYEIIPYILSECRNLSEAKAVINQTEIISIPFKNNLQLSPLHWQIADKNGSLTLEKTAEGMKLYENPSNILTNNPPFPFHLQNREHFLYLSPENPVHSHGGILGLGTSGMCGGFTPAERFIRADYLLKNTPEDIADISHLFHILDSTAIPKGAVLTDDRKFHFTSYSCCFDPEKLLYYYRTYEELCPETMTIATEGNTLTINEYRKNKRAL